MRRPSPHYRVLSTLAFVLGALTAVRPAQAQTFSPVSALSFTKAVSGANPLPQHITVTSTGAAFAFTASVTAGSDWLSVSLPGGCCTSMPRVLTVNVADAGLAAGTYNGQITLNATSPVTSLVIPVTLTVSATSQAFFDALPGALTFSKTPSATTVTSQEFQIRNAGQGTLNWTATRSTSDGGNWITISSTGAAAPSNFTVGVAPAQLPGGGSVPGTYTGQVVLASSNGSVTVPVSVAVGDNVLTQVNPLAFAKLFEGANPLPQILTIARTGSSALTVTFQSANSNGGNWLSVAATGAGVPQTLTVTANPASNLAAGSYTGQILVRTTSGDLALSIPVSLSVASAGSAVFAALPGNLSFTLPTSGTSIASQTISVRNGGSGTLNWTASANTADTSPWISLSPSSGTAPSSIGVQIAIANLPGGGTVAGTYIGQVVLNDGVRNATVPVAVKVGDTVLRQFGAISFTKVFGGANPLPQSVTISRIGSSPLGISIQAASSGGAWLSVSPTNNVCCFVTPQVLTASIVADPSLAVGTYAAQILVTSQSGDASMTIPVTLTVTPAGGSYFDNVPGQLTFSMATAGTAPPTQQIQLRNVGASALSWSSSKTTSDNGDWITVSPASGTTPTNITIGVNLANLPGQGQTAGTFTGVVSFVHASGTVSIPVTVTVGPSVFTQVAPLNFTRIAGGAEAPSQVLSVTATGAPLTNFTLTDATGNAVDWLSVTPVGAYSTPQNFTVAINSGSLAVGTYTGQIVFTAAAGNTTMTVPVTLRVVTGGAQPISVTPASGTAGRQVFNFLARRNAGAAGIQYVQFLFSRSGINALNACYVSYDPAQNVYYLLSDDTTQWYGLVAGTANTIGNSQCTIHASAGGSSQSGSDLTTTIDISFRSGFAGQKSIYQFAGEVGGALSGWQLMGTWNDSGDLNVVELISLSPNSGTGVSQTFTALTRDGNGANTIAFVQLVMNAELSGLNGCFIHYDRASNVFFLLNDSATEWFGLVAGSGQVGNSQCTLFGSGSGGVVSGNDLTITYNLSFSAGFSGTKKIFMQPVDNTGVIQVWRQMGTWIR